MIENLYYRFSSEDKNMSGEHLVRKEFLNFNFFTRNMDNQKYLEIQNSIDKINTLNPN